MSNSPILDEARKAIQLGQRGRAKDLLTRLLNTEKNDPECWLLMSTVVRSHKERIYCLQAALKLDPDNADARYGLTLLGSLPPDNNIEPVLPFRRKWDVTLDEDELTGINKIMANPLLRTITFTSAGILVVGLILMGIYANPGTLFRAPATSLPSWTPTPTQTFTPTPLIRTSTPTPATAIPLWMLLDATYTPIPAYVNTPHPLSEAYRSAMRSYERGDYVTMLTFMLQANRNEPDSPDILYYIGEAYRLQGEYDAALESYENAIEIDPRFAPAYLGRARVRLFNNPRIDISSDLESAIDYDPAYGEAYLELMNYQIDQGDDILAILEVLDTAQDYLAFNPEFYLLRAKAKLAIGDAEGALQDSVTANELDITNLDSYIVLAQAYLANDMYEEALQELIFYGQYENKNPLYWALLGWTHQGIEDYETAFENFDKALEMDSNLIESHLYRGRTYLKLGKTEEAIRDFYLARQIDPGSFDAPFYYAMVLVADERQEESILFFNIAEDSAISDRQRAMVYYNRALANDSIRLSNDAEEDFKLLILLPSGSAPRLWILRANQYLATATPTPTQSNTPQPTRTPTLTSTYTPTSTYTLTPTLTNTPTNTPTSTYTLTPTKTSTPSLTLTQPPTQTPSQAP